MRKWIMLLLALALVMTSAALAEEPALPEAGTVTEGFEVTEIRPFPALGAQLVAMEHQQTGAKLLWIANDDTNRAFSLTFGTQAVDNTGLPHVFEHATLSGSERFPSKNLFFNLSYQTYQTYMNAYTQDRCTGYPVASLSEAQLLKLADFYTDCCFNPSVMTDGTIWREEAWRYRLESEDAPLTLEGTVYSEMKGALTLPRAAYKNWTRSVFPGSYLGFEQGGDPASIPDMTWDTLKAYHDRFYHPSNCAAILYGKLENVNAFLALLNAEFSKYERREFTVTDEQYVPLTESVTAEHAYPFEAAADPARKTTVIHSFALPESSWENVDQLSFLASLFSDSQSAMARSIRKALPNASFSSGLEIAGPVPAMLFEADNVDPADAETFVALVEAGIADVAENGFAKDMMDSVAASQALSNLLMGETDNLGVSLMSSVAYDWSVFGNIFYFFDYFEEVDRLTEWNDAGVFSGLCAEYLGENAIRVTDVTYPQPGLREELDAAETERLAGVKAAMSDEEKQALIADAAAGEAEETVDTAAMIRELTAVTTDSLPEEIREYDVKDETDENGVRWLTAEAGVDGVAMVNFRLDADPLSMEELQYLKLYKDLINYLDTTKHTQDELTSLRARYLYDGTIAISLARVDGTCRPGLMFQWISLTDDLPQGYALMQELFFDLDTDNTALLADGIGALAVANRNSMTQSPYNEGITRAFGITDSVYQVSSCLGGVLYQEFLGGVLAQMEADPAVVSANLAAVRERMRSADGAAILFAGDSATEAVSRPLAQAWLDEREINPRLIPAASGREALILDINIQYNGMAADYAALGLEGFNAGLDAVTSLVNDKFLVPMLRDGYGVYSPMHGALNYAGVYLLAYRDPNIRETFAVFSQLGDLLENLEITQEELDGYILSSYAYYATPAGELTGAMNADYSVLAGEDPAMNLTCMRQLKALTPEAVHGYADMYRRMAEYGVVFTEGSAAAINANADLYEAILNPFAVADTSEVAFADVTEDMPEYAAVRFAFENGLMQPAGSDAFGTAEEASAGELAVALFKAVGLGVSDDPAEAVAALSAYGIVPADQDPAAPLTRGMAAEFVANLMIVMGNEASAPAPEGLTDADTVSGAMGWALQVGLLNAVETENGPAAAADQVLTRAGLADVLYVLLGE